MGIMPYGASIPYSVSYGTADYLIRMNGINQFAFNKIMSQYLVFKFEGFIELDFQIWCKSFKTGEFGIRVQMKKKKKF